MPEYRWTPIEPLSEADRNIDLADIKPVYEAWRAAKAQLQQSSSSSLREFNERLIRRLSIESGILERIYDLDRATTELLVTRGFVEELVSHSSTNIEPGRLVDILRDQESAIHLMIDCVAHSRDITKGVIHELHAILTRRQDTTTAVDQFGYRHEILLLKGAFKQQPNNPTRPDDTQHEYCPPVQVDTEIENLLKWLSEYSSENPIIVAAWFHHRFTQIHPYQDGNGRVARALTTHRLLRAQLLPLIIDRDLRAEYIAALEMADDRDLTPLASLFARLVRSAILQALSVDADAEIPHQKALTSAAIENLAAKFRKRGEAKSAELRTVNAVAVQLRMQGHGILERTLNELSDPLTEIANPTMFVVDGGTDRENGHYYKHEVVQTAIASNKFANFAEDHYFLKASIRAGHERLVFVISFHHVGRELTGLMEATAFAMLETFEDSHDRVSVTDSFFVCSVEPFVFSHTSNGTEITASFARWVDAALAVAIKEYGDRL